MVLIESEFCGIKKKILIIEDSIDTRVLYKKALEMEDYQVSMVGSGQEAIEHLKSERPDLLLLDLSLPEMSGEELLQIIRSNADWATLKVIVVSGWDNLKTRAREIGANGCIRKPFELSKLYEEVDRFLSPLGSDRI
jgi:DNA-binding response OmpR family regulator